MADIPRRRQPPSVSQVGMTAPESAPPEVQRHVGELQQAIENLSRRLAALESSAKPEDAVAQKVNRIEQNLEVIQAQQLDQYSLVCFAKNTGTVDLAKFRPAVIRSQLIPLTDPRIHSLPLLSVSAITSADSSVPFVVPQEPIAANAIGKVVLSGLTLVAVTGSGAKATVTGTSSTTALVVGTSGEAEVLWTSSGYAMARLGAGGGGSVNVGGIPVPISGTGGTDGLSENAARSDHRHGILSTLSSTAANGSLSMSSAKLYARLGGTWLCVSHFE